MAKEKKTVGFLLNNAKSNPEKTFEGTDCLEWQMCKDKLGYGGVMHDGEKVHTHRLMWRLWHEVDLRKDEFVLHKCDNPKCLNIYHLRVGTHQDNMKDRDNKGRQSQGQKASDAIRGTRQKSLNDTSKYVGVYFSKSANKWVARIRIVLNNKQTRLYLGVFEDAYLAAIKYDNALREHCPDKAEALANFPMIDQPQPAK